MADTIEINLNSIESCNSLLELRDAFQKIIQNYGFSSFGIIDASDVWDDNPLVLATHSMSWIDTYRSENFLEVDPCLAIGRRTNKPFMWSNIKLPTPLGKRRPGAYKTMAAARDHGIMDGITCPIHYVDALGRRYSSICALFWKDSTQALSRNLGSIRGELHIILLYFAQKIADLYAEEQKITGRLYNIERDRIVYILSDREKEVLKWAGLGKTIEETADVLKLGKETVTSYIKNAMDKLGAVTKTQAVVRAVYERQIDLN